MSSAAGIAGLGWVSTTRTTGRERSTSWLGYQETGCHYLDRYHYIDDHGIRHEVADPARFLLKQLPAAPIPIRGAAPAE